MLLPACRTSFPVIPLLGCGAFEFAAALVGAISVWLSVRERVAAWPTGIVNVLMYTWVFWCSRLYADMGLQVVYAGISAYGWWHWLRGGAGQGALPVTRMPRRYWLPLSLLVVASAALLGAWLRHGTDAVLPWRDAALSAGSLAAQWMLSRKYLENWALWIVLDVAYVWTFWGQSLRCTAILYCAFLLLAIAGWRQWRRALDAPPRPTPA